LYLGQASFLKTRPHYYVRTHTKWVFLGLLQLANEQFQPLHLNAEELVFDVEDASLLGQAKP
jgi:hypothetical protein